MQKPKIPSNEKERQQALDAYKVLDSLPQKSFDDLTLIASQICQTPIALISLIDKDRQWFKSKYGIEASETHRDYSFCGHAINEPDRILEVTDVKKDDRFSDNPLVKGNPNIGFYAGVPLLHSDDIAIGTLCVIDTKPKKLSTNQKAALKALADEVMNRFKLNTSYKKLHKTNEQFFTSINNINGKIFETDKDLNFLFVNDFMVNSLDYNKEKLLTMSFFDIIYPNDHETVKHNLEKLLLKNNNEVNFECRLFNKDKELRWINQNIKALKNANQIEKLLGFSRDITQEKEFTKTIKEKSYLLEQSESLSKVGHWELNLENNEVFWSDETKRIHEVNLNFTPNLATGIDFYHENSKSIITETIEKAVSTGKGWDVSLQIVTAKGKLKWVRSIGKVHTKNQEPYKIIGVFQDITESKLYEEALLLSKSKITKLNKELENKVDSKTQALKEEQDKYQKLYHEAPDMMISIDLKTRKIIDCNNTLCTKLGLTQNEIVGKDILQFYHPDCYKDVDKAFKEFVETGVVQNKKLILKTKKGKKVPVALNVRGVKDKNGNITHSNSIWRDITELQKAEDKLNLLNRQLEKKVEERTKELALAHEELEDFTYITTHDIKSPLTNIKGYSSILEKKLNKHEDPLVHQSLSWIQRLNEQAMSKVESVIEVVKAKKRGAAEKIILKELLNEVLSELISLEDDILVKTELNDKTEVLFNRTNLKSVLQNLIHNAIKYRKENGILELLVKVEETSECVKFSVADNGLGINLDKNGKKLFKMFSRIHDHVKGSGMGLYLVKKILEADNASISINSKIGKGSTFTVIINKHDKIKNRIAN